MKVRLIDYTGANSYMDKTYAAKLLVYTKNTRLTQGEDTRSMVEQMSHTKLMEELAYIANTIRSSWEFVDYVFEIEGVTRAFTHQLVRTRTASYAQQAQRVVKLEKLEVLKPASVDKSNYANDVWEHCVQTIENAYKSLIEHGIAVEDARGLLPTNVKTNIIVKMNLRTLADLAGKRDNPRAQGEYVSVIREMTFLVDEIHPWTRNFLYPDRTSCPELNKLLAAYDLFEKGECVAEHAMPVMKEVYKEIDRLKGVWG